jgi:hypothetical protein
MTCVGHARDCMLMMRAVRPCKFMNAQTDASAWGMCVCVCVCVCLCVCGIDRLGHFSHTSHMCRVLTVSAEKLGAILSLISVQTHRTSQLIEFMAYL